MVEEGPSEEVAAEAAMERPAWPESRWEGEGRRQGEPIIQVLGEEGGCILRVLGNPWGVFFGSHPRTFFSLLLERGVGREEH